jgi:hypothetical protein
MARAVQQVRERLAGIFNAAIAAFTASKTKKSHPIYIGWLKKSKPEEEEGVLTCNFGYSTHQLRSGSQFGISTALSAMMQYYGGNCYNNSYNFLKTDT